MPVQELFGKCVGVVVMSIVQGGFMFSGSLGTGIILKKKEAKPDGNGYVWSLPSAVGLSGIGYGFLAGVSHKDLLIFIMDDITFQSIASESKGFKFGGQVEGTLGLIGRAMKLDFNWNTHKEQGGFGSTVSVAYSKGLFLGISLEGAVIGRRDVCNIRFYDGDYSPLSIINNDDNKITIPEGKVTLIDEVYTKLNVLASGKAFEVSEEEKTKIEEAKVNADSIHQSILATDNNNTNNEDDHIVPVEPVEEVEEQK